MQLDWVVQTHQGSELRVLVCQKELGLLKSDFRVHPGHRDILELDLALMSSAHSDRFAFFWAKEMQASLIFALLSFVHIFYHHEGFGWFLDV